ncbi:MAG: DUF4908 domain-containing protein [Rhizomicrobium sp.]|jgi:hypothetical protein
MRRLLWLPFVLMFAFPPPAPAQDSLQDRLSADRVGYIAPGVYLAGDRVGFSLDPAGTNYLLRVQGSPEIFVLYQDRAAMGGRVLKYDSGEMAISVSGFGGVTLYVSSVPQGLPAERTGESMPPSLSPVSLQEVQGAAADEAQHLSYTRRLNVNFTANWGMLAGDPPARAFALDTIGNTARGIDRFAASPAGHDAFARRVDMVSFEENSRPTLTLNGRTLIVTFNPARGFIGRASSRAIASGLARVL